MFSPWSPTLHHTPSIKVGSGSYQLPLVPSSLARHPHAWTKEEVKIWLKWCAEEFAIDPVCSDTFDMNGKALDLLTRQDFIDREPKSGDLLFNALQRLIRKHDATLAVPCRFPPYTPAHHENCCYDSLSPVASNSRQNGFYLVSAHTASAVNRVKSEPSYVSILPSPLPSLASLEERNCSSSVSAIVPESVLTPVSTNHDSDSTISDADSTQTGDMLIDLGENCNSNEVSDRQEDTFTNHLKKENGGDMSRDLGENCNSNEVSDRQQDTFTNHLKKEDGDCRLLWEFIHQLLTDPKYQDYVLWENEADLIFRIVNPTGLAGLWGLQKNRTNMTYEKLSRALRYYYKMNIIKKVPGKRLTYKFLQHPRNITKGQRGARPHSVRQPPVGSQCLKPRNVNIINETDATQLSFSESQCAMHDIHHGDRNPFPGSHSPLRSSSEWDHSPRRNPLHGSRDSYDESCDLQFINGRLITVEGSPNHEHQSVCSDSIKHEIPVQNEPEDLSMKTTLKRCNSESYVLETTETGYHNCYNMGLRGNAVKTEGCS